MPTARIVGGAALAVIAVAWALPASACSCGHRERASVIASADVAFEGEVLGIRAAAPGAAYPQVTTLRVLSAIKGSLGQTVDISTRTFSPSCGYDFRHADKQLTVAAFRAAEGGLTTNLCAMFNVNRRR